jgi:hypothetical protein
MKNINASPIEGARTAFQALPIGAAFRLPVTGGGYIGDIYFKTGAGTYGTRPGSALWKWREAAGVVEPVSSPSSVRPLNERIVDAATGLASFPMRAWTGDGTPGRWRTPAKRDHMNKPFHAIAAFAELTAIQPLNQRQYRHYRSVVEQISLSGRLQTPFPHSGDFDTEVLGALLLTHDVCLIEIEDGGRFSCRSAFGSTQGAFFIPQGQITELERQVQQARQWLRATLVESAMRAVGKLQAEFVGTPAEHDRLKAHLTGLTARLVKRMPR